MMDEEEVRRRLYLEDHSCPECKSANKKVYYDKSNQMLQHRRFYHAGEANYVPEAYKKKK